MPKVLDGPEPIYLNPRAVPRVFTAGRYQRVRSDSESLAWLRTPLFAPRETVLLEAADADRLPGAFKAAASDSDALGLELLSCQTAAEREADRIADDAARARAHVARPPWGWSGGDDLAVRLRPTSPIPRAVLLVRYYAGDRPGRMPLRLAGPDGERDLAIELPGATAAGSSGTAGRQAVAGPEAAPDLDVDGTARAALELGALAASEYTLRVTTEADCPARIDSLSIMTAPPARAEPAGTARITSFSPNRIELDVTLDRPGFLVASEVHYPGWEARVDGRAAAVLRADFILRAVPVEAGRHRVSLAFRSRSFAAGCAITLSTLGVLIAALIWARIRGRRREAVPAVEAASV
jgi:hypothetical protein